MALVVAHSSPNEVDITEPDAPDALTNAEIIKEDTPVDKFRKLPVNVRVRQIPIAQSAAFRIMLIKCGSAGPPTAGLSPVSVVGSRAVIPAQRAAGARCLTCCPRRSLRCWPARAAEQFTALSVLCR
eukprot:5941440-Pleurochrysis_carterae.AAC.1